MNKLNTYVKDKYYLPKLEILIIGCQIKAGKRKQQLEPMQYKVVKTCQLFFQPQ
jgi:hypothetical protein